MAKNQKDIPAANVPPEKLEVSTPCWAPQPEESEIGRGNHMTSSYISGILSTMERWKSARNPGALLKGQHTKSHSQPLTLGYSRRNANGVDWRHARTD